MSDIVDRMQKRVETINRVGGDLVAKGMFIEAITEITRLREERRRREALWQASANETRLVYGGVFRPQPLPPGPEVDG